MRITFQTSGGRGEYEVAGKLPRGIDMTTLTDRGLRLRVGDSELRTGCTLTAQGAKHRLRMTAGAEMQVQRQLEALLLLPKSIRDADRLGAGQPVIRESAYFLSDIKTADVELVGRGEFRARVSLLRFENASHRGKRSEVRDAHDRYANLKLVWSNAELFPEPLQSLLRDHHAIAQSGTPVPSEAERLCRAIRKTLADQRWSLGVSDTYDSDGDPLPVLLKVVAVSGVEEQADLDELKRQDVELRKRTVRRTRQATQRGPAAAKFRRRVRDAYDHRCLICGERFPATDFNSSGVEGAHILPFARYDLDVVYNGVALCKTDHWAFEEGIVILSAEDDGSYRLEVPREAEDALGDAGFDLDRFRDLEGLIPDERLPTRQEDRPHPDLLSELREIVLP